MRLMLLLQIADVRVKLAVIGARQKTPAPLLITFENVGRIVHPYLDHLITELHIDLLQGPAKQFPGVAFLQVQVAPQVARTRARLPEAALCVGKQFLLAAGH